MSFTFLSLKVLSLCSDHKISVVCVVINVHIFDGSLDWFVKAYFQLQVVATVVVAAMEIKATMEVAMEIMEVVTITRGVGIQGVHAVHC